MPVLLGIDNQGVTDEALDVAEIVALVGTTKGCSVAGGTGTTGAANAVNVGFRFVRQVEVDDQSHGLDVHTASGDVGGDENGDLALTETIEGLIALWLRAIAVDGLCGEAAFADEFGELVRTVFGAGKDDRQFTGLLLFEQFEKQVTFVFPFDEADALLDLLGSGGFRSDRYGDWIDEDRVGEIHHGRGQGGREKQRLPLLGKERDDALDIALEAHVEHAVDFIEDEEVDTREFDVTLVDQVEKTTGAGDEDIDAAAHGIDLWSLADAAVNEGVLDFDVLAVGFEALADLGGEFTGWSEHENAWALGAKRTWVGVEFLQNRQREGGGLAGSRLGATKQVAAFKQMRNGLGLNWRRGGVFALGESALDGRSQWQRLECIRGHVVGGPASYLVPGRVSMRVC